MLDKSQADALVYSTLCGFMLVGLVAGYYTKTKREFFSGVRTQPDMSGSLLQSYPQLALIPNAGLLGISAYAFSTIAPLWAFAFLGPYIRRIAPDGFTLSEFIRRRYGWPIGVLSALVFVGFMFCFMWVELNTYGSVVSTIGNVHPIVAPLIIAVTTTIYTAYGGFKASLWTDNVNAVVVVVFVIIAAIAIGTRLDVQLEGHEWPAWRDHMLVEGHSLGGQLWYILTVAIVFAQMFNQGFWQRAFASRTNGGLYASVALATVPLFAIVFIVGVSGPVAQWSGLQCPIDMDTQMAIPCSQNDYDPAGSGDDGSFALFRILQVMPNWVQGITIVLAGVLSSSAYDTFQSAQISVIQNDVFLGRLNIWWCRLILVLINVPCVALSSYNIDILQVFVVADLIGLAVIPCVFLGLPKFMYAYSGLDVVVGGCGGFLTLWVYGTIFYHDPVVGARIFSLPEGLYVNDYSVLGAFFAAPLGCIGFALGSCGVRIACLWLYARFTNTEFTALDRPEVVDPASCVLPEDRPVSFLGFKGSGNPNDGHKLEDNESDEFHSPFHK
ncbi:hypothetical protein MCUN1_002220 [Malassezia cuniculi]|uniref:Urea transporter n=1 Tax=Malassezia cuniculi TaxID=948313 RepID=A0AAF0EW08_9BASI|nr:hypothetical protein MCUN1_002220 [Malassezia cuniculi]